MNGVARYAAKKWLEHVTGKTDIGTMPTGYIALLTVMPAEDGTGYTEATIARFATTGTDWNAASNGPPPFIDNAVDFAFAAPSPGSPETAIGFALMDASSSGNFQLADYLGNHPWKPFSCTSASPGVITCPGHGLSNGDKVVVSDRLAGTLPTTGGSWSGLLTVAGVSGDTFTLGVNTTGTGNGLLRKVTTYPIVSGASVTVAAGDLVLRLG